MDLFFEFGHKGVSQRYLNFSVPKTRLRKGLHI